MGVTARCYEVAEVHPLRTLDRQPTRFVPRFFFLSFLNIPLHTIHLTCGYWASTSTRLYWNNL